MNEIEFLKSLRALPNKKGSHTALQPPLNGIIYADQYWSRSHYIGKLQVTCGKFQNFASIALIFLRITDLSM